MIHGLSDGRVALLTKMHHAAVDGMSGAEVLSVLLDPSPEGRDVRRPRRTGRTPGPGRASDARPRPRRRAAPAAACARGDAAHASAPRQRGDDPPSPGCPDGGGAASRGAQRTAAALSAPRTRFQGSIPPHRRVAFGSLSLDDVKAIKNAAGFTVNDVVMTVCAGALRDWLAARDELPAEPLLTMVPVSVRTPDERGTFGNRISTMIVPLPTDEPDPLARLQRVHEAMRSAKERHRATPATLLQDANHFIPPALLARAARVTSRVAVTRRLRRRSTS